MIFRKKRKPFLSGKRTKTSKITLVRNEKVISDDQQLFKIFSNFFQDALKPLAVKVGVGKYDCLESNDTVENVIRKYNKHSSIKKT